MKLRIFDGRRVTVAHALGGHDAMAGMQRRVLLPRNIRIQQDTDELITSQPEEVAPDPRRNNPPPPQSKTPRKSTQQLSKMQEDEQTVVIPADSSAHSTANQTQNETLPRIIHRRQPRILRPAALSVNPNMIGYTASRPEQKHDAMSRNMSSEIGTSNLPATFSDTSDFSQDHILVPSTKKANLSSRRRGLHQEAAVLRTRVNSDARYLENVQHTSLQTQPTPAVSVSSPLPTPPTPPTPTSSEVMDISSSFSSESTLADSEQPGRISLGEDPVQTKAPKKRPSWASNWSKGVSQASASHNADNSPSRNIITGGSLSLGSPSSMGGVDSNAKAFPRMAARVTGATSGFVGPSVPLSKIQIVLKDGEWQLEGHECDIAAIDKSIPVLQARLIGGVKAEQEHEREALQRLYSNTSLKRLQRDGVVITGLNATPNGTLFRSALWKFTPSRPPPNQGEDTSITKSKKHPSEGFELPFNKFRPGDSVLITSSDNVTSTSTRRGLSLSGGGGSESPYMEGILLEQRKGHLLVSLDWKDSEVLEATTKGATWRLDQSVRDTTAQRQIEAIQKLPSWSDPEAPSEKLIRCIIVGSPSAPLIADQPPLWVREASWREDAKTALASQDGLNNSQRRAVAKAMVSSLTLWQGPPGTGKTRTLLALIQVLVGTAIKKKERWRSMGPVLACADTNAAVDNLVEGLLARGIRVVRVGNPAKVRSHLRSLTLEALAEASPPGQVAVKLRESAKQDLERCKEIRASGDRLEPVMLSRLADVEGRARSDWSRADLALRDAMADVVDKAQVICSTCTGAGDYSLAERIFRVVVIDEATQATEPAVLVPLTRGAQCVVMAGDPKQLPPTVVSQQALKFSLDVTLFDRISENGVQPLLLDTQYRMNPGISKFPSSWFYGSRLKDGVQASEKPPPKGLLWPRPDLPVAMIPVDGLEEKSNSHDLGVSAGGGMGAGSGTAGSGGDGVSYRNVAEARIALQVVNALLRSKDVQSAAVLTPYRGQVRCLEGLLRTYAQHFEGLDITVSSVDGYQGREADVVVFSAVRCNSAGSLGFVADPRRLNVAITRPRRGLVVVGSPSTLERGGHDWRAYMGWVRAEAIMLDSSRLPPPPWDEHTEPGGGGK